MPTANGFYGYTELEAYQLPRITCDASCLLTSPKTGQISLGPCGSLCFNSALILIVIFKTSFKECFLICSSAALYQSAHHHLKSNQGRHCAAECPGQEEGPARRSVLLTVLLLHWSVLSDDLQRSAQSKPHVVNDHSEYQTNQTHNPSLS